MIVLQKAIIQHPSRGTFSTLHVGDRQFFTVERPWQDNEPFVSCIPAGRYQMDWRPTSTDVPESFGGFTWWISGGTVGHYEGDRTACVWHVANYARQVEGCTGPGLGLRLDRSDWMVTSSEAALVELRELLPDSFELVIDRGAEIFPTDIGEPQH